MAGDGGPLLKLLDPPVVVRLGAAAFAVVLLAVGVMTLTDFSARAGLDAGAAAAAPDGPLRASGEVATVYQDEAGPVTTIVLRGAPDLEFEIQGPFAGGIPTGSYVTMEGTKAGNRVHASAVVLGTNPGVAAGPYLAIGLALVGILGADLAIPIMMARRLTPRALGHALMRPIQALRNRRLERDEAAPGGADNHSGAPQPKG